MAALRYDLATVAVFDPVAMNRNATRNVLFALGFREIETFSSLEDLRRASTTRDFDVIVLEAVKADDPVYEFVNKTRRGAMMRNPFGIMLLTTWVPQHEIVRSGLDCGADDLICRPFSTAQLADRIRTHAVARKSFVVTSDYIGPDRRKDTTRTSNVKPIDVVNSLKLKAVDAMDNAAVQAITEIAIQEGRQVVSLERMRRLAFQIGVVAGFVSSQVETMVEGGVRRSDLDKIVSTARDIIALARTEAHDQAVRTGETVISVAAQCLDGENLSRNAKLLVRLSIALQMILSPDLNENDCQAELNETLERIRVRGRQS